MKLRHKIGLGFLTVIGVAVIALAVTVSYTKDCPELSASDIDGPVNECVDRRAATARRMSYELETLAIPDLAEDEILVKVSAAGVNPLDWHYMRGTPLPDAPDGGSWCA